MKEEYMYIMYIYLAIFNNYEYIHLISRIISIQILRPNCFYPFSYPHRPTWCMLCPYRPRINHLNSIRWM